MSKQIEEVMDLVREYASESESFPTYSTLEDVELAWKAIESKLRELLPVWQPIESAPKDGSCIILGLEESEDHGAVSTPGFWSEGIGDAPDEMGHDDGFTDVNFQIFRGGRSWGVEKYRYPAFQPTRWMPLPKAPE